MTAVWPTLLPQCILVNGFASGPHDGRLRTSMERGPDKRRLATSAAVRPVNATIYLTTNQRALLERFWNETLGGGVLPFVMRDSRLHNYALGDDSGSPLTDQAGNHLLISAYNLMRFSNPYEDVAMGGSKYRVVLSLEALV